MTQISPEFIKEYEEKSLKEAELFKKLRKYEEENKLLFFGIRDLERAEYHDECCRLFRGANPLQDEILDAFLDEFYKLLTYTGGNRLGKTAIAVILSYCVMHGKYPWSGHKIPFPHRLPRKVRYIGQDWEKHIKAVVEPELTKWWPKMWPRRLKKNNFGVDAFIRCEKTGSTLEIMSNNQDSDQHEGWSGDLVVYDEPPKRDVRVANARGLVDRQGREFFAMTLLKEPWIDREVIKAKTDDGRPNLRVYNVTGESAVNIGYGIDEAGLEQFKSTLRPHEVESRIKGVPSYRSSIIWSNFVRRIHLKRRFRVPLDWIVDIAIDFHPSKKWAILFRATNPQEFRYCVDEIHENGSWKYIGEQIIRKIKTNMYRVGTIICDPLAKGDRQSDLQEESVFDKLNRFFVAYGCTLRTASKDEEGGIVFVQDRLWTENEMPGLFFFDDLKVTIDHVENWMRDPETNKPAREQEDMCENLYRLELLDTRWYPLEDDAEVLQQSDRNPHTGY